MMNKKKKEKVSNNKNRSKIVVIDEQDSGLKKYGIKERTNL